MLLGSAFLLDMVWLVRALGSTWAFAFLDAKAGLEDYYYSRCLSCQLGKDVNPVLFQRIQTRLLSSYRASTTRAGPRNNGAYSMKDITTAWGQEAVKRGRQIFEADQLPFFGREFQEDILVWHIGTCILIACADQQHVQGTYGRAIEVLSEYLMFLVAVRRHMLPGLVLRSLFEVTRQAMADVWADNNNRSYSCLRSRKEMLANTLYELKVVNEDWGLNNANTRLISDGIDLATVLLQVEEKYMPKLMELVFDVWIDKLLYAGTRCCRESHAKQLSHGAELTSIVWIITEHAGP
jgi:hypothetical protein